MLMMPWILVKELVQPGLQVVEICGSGKEPIFGTVKVWSCDLVCFEFLFDFFFTEKMDEVCPNQECLGNVICRYNTFRCDYSDCQVFTTHVSSKDTCDDSSLCTVDGVQCDGQEVCAYCPPGEPSCIPIDGVTTEDECNSIVWCAKPNGQFELASSEEECRQSYQECTTGCVGAGCQSNFGRDIAICYVANIATSDCWAIGGWWYDSVNACFLEHISDSDTCLVCFFFSLLSNLHAINPFSSCGVLLGMIHPGNHVICLLRIAPVIN